MLAKIKHFGKLSAQRAKSAEKDLFTAVIIILVAFLSFGLGRLSKIRENKEPVSIRLPEATALSSVKTPNEPENLSIQAVKDEKLFMGSKNGTKYYYPWCGNNIKEENKVWFTTKEDAQKAGYTPAKNCKGLE